MILTRIDKNNYKWFADIIFLDSVELDNVVLVGVIEDDRPIAAGALTLAFGGASIVSLYTVGEYRRRGAATMILNSFFEIALVAGVERVEADFALTDELEGLMKSAGYDVFDSDGELVVSKRTLLSSSKIKRLKKMNLKKRVRSYDNLSELMKEEALKRMRELGINALPKNCDEKISALSYGRNRKLTGGLFVSTHGEDLYLDLLFGNGQDPMGPMILTAHFVQQLSENKEIKTVHAYPYNEKINNLIYFLADGKKVKPGVRSAYAVRFIDG